LELSQHAIEKEFEHTTVKSAPQRFICICAMNKMMIIAHGGYMLEQQNTSRLYW
jgi:hypothetical protein